LSRYGQNRPVSVFILRNPQTVEARIWDLLNEKLERIQLALSSVMEEQEDISQLVIGMAGNSLFNELFSGGEGLSNDRLEAWFDQATATLGGSCTDSTSSRSASSISTDFQSSRYSRGTLNSLGCRRERVLHSVDTQRNHHRYRDGANDPKVSLLTIDGVNPVAQSLINVLHLLGKSGEGL
jgi:hypothetical protein